MGKQRVRMNLSVDEETYARASVMARRMGFRSPCAMTTEMLDRVTRLGAPTEQEVDDMESDISSMFNNFMEWDENPSTDTRIRMRLRTE